MSCHVMTADQKTKNVLEERQTCALPHVIYPSPVDVSFGLGYELLGLFPVSSSPASCTYYLVQ